MICDYCPHGCEISENNHGFCGTKSLVDGKIESRVKGQITSISLDPIEKKPLRRFFPGFSILSIGFWGCNMRCPWCQNDEISRGIASHYDLTPEQVVREARRKLEDHENIGIAFTYNEPLTNIDYVIETAALGKERGLRTVMVSNGMVSDKHLERVLPFIDAWNIDLKTSDPSKYRKIGGDLDTVLNTIKRAHKFGHVEVTTLIVPGFNDNVEDIEAVADIIASIDDQIPLHVTRFFPACDMKDVDPTPVSLVYEFRDIAAKKLKYVYTGNC